MMIFLNIYSVTKYKNAFDIRFDFIASFEIKSLLSKRLRESLRIQMSY